VSELRKDPTTGRWVIIATERVRRPADFSRPRSPRDGGPCAFCPGRERETPPEILAYRDPAAATPNGPGWRVRVVPNKFPALRIEGDLERRGQEMYDLMNAVGAHELILESPAHEQILADLSAQGVEEILRACRERIGDLKRDQRFRSVTVFEHHGTDTGAPVTHPHVQLLAAPIVPFLLVEELDHARAYHDYHERCLFCDMLLHEVEARARLIIETPHVVAFAPFAARVPFETWLLPRRHAAAFEHATAEELHDTACLLRAVLRKLDRAVADPPYDLLLHSAPFRSSDSPSYHWHIEIAPALPGGAALDGGSGMHVNPLPPEDAARFLRATPD
jgi:UDPglucose--hexose-1-phosphate uridylyltransferase